MSKYCGNCGAQLPDNAKFCDKCGGKIEDVKTNVNFTKKHNIQKENILALSLGKKLVLVGAIISFISLFFTWVNIGIAQVDGFQQQGYIVLAAFIYPIVMILQNKRINIMFGIISLVVGIFIMFAMIESKSTTIFGSSVNVSASGMYIMIIGLIVSIVGVVLENKNI
ncbi:MAG: zinc-ribbon domain-containing protein [Clostridium sp.]|nr:zinc-ribbon domain-containing protein [Clostridium sp.]